MGDSNVLICFFVVIFVIGFFIGALLAGQRQIMKMIKDRKDNVEVRYIFVSEKEIKKDSLLDLIRKVTETNEHKFL